MAAVRPRRTRPAAGQSDGAGHRPVAPAPGPKCDVPGRSGAAVLAHAVDTPPRSRGPVLPSLTIYFGAVIAFFVGFGVFWGPLPLYLSRTLGYESGLVFALYLVSSVGSALWYDRAGALAERYSPSGLQVGGLLARAALHPAVAVVGLLLSATLLGTIINGVVFVLIGVAWAVIAVTAASVVTQLAPSAIRGEALGIYTAVSGLASGVGSLLGGWLGGYDFLLAFAVAGALVLVGAALVAVVWRRSPAVSVDSEPLSA